VAGSSPIVTSQGGVSSGSVSPISATASNLGPGLSLPDQRLPSESTSGCITSIVVSHDVHEIGEVADYSYVIADGKVAAQGRPEDLKNDSSELVKQFMLGLADGPVAFHYDAPDYEEQLLGPGRG